MAKKIESLEDLAQEARAFVRAIRPQEERATLITLSGELGAGKTAFTKAVAEALGVGEIVNSPTFVLEKIYALPEGSAFKHLIHIDAYRLESGSELGPLGFDKVMKDAANLVMLEWPEKVADALPRPDAVLILEALEDGAHTIAYGD